MKANIIQQSILIFTDEILYSKDYGPFKTLLKPFMRRLVIVKSINAYDESLELYKVTP